MIIYQMHHLTAAFTSVIMVFPLWMLLDRDPPYIITNGRIAPQTITADGEYVVTWDIETKRPCPATENSSVVTHIIDVNNEDHVYIKTRGAYINDASNIVKTKKMLDVPPGPAQYYSHICYPCNPIQEWWPVCFDSPKIPFTVGTRP